MTIVLHISNSPAHDLPLIDLYTLQITKNVNLIINMDLYRYRKHPHTHADTIKIKSNFN